MAWTEISDNDIMLQQPAATYGFTASGTIYKGQGVYLCANNKVKAGDAVNKMGIGVAANDASDGEVIGVHGVGCICQTRISGSISVGSTVGLEVDGKWGTNNTTYHTAIVTKAAAANGGVGEILIMGGYK